MNVDAACLAFAMLADFVGTVTRKGEYRLGLCAGNNRDFAEKFAELANRTFYVHYIKPDREDNECVVCFHYKSLWKWYRKYFTFGKYGWKIKPKTMEWLLQQEPKDLGRILSWYFEGDGTIKKDGQWFSATSVNKKGLEQIQELVESLGIKTSLGGTLRVKEGLRELCFEHRAGKRQEIRGTNRVCE